jgi:hypothetical protein
MSTRTKSIQVLDLIKVSGSITRPANTTAYASGDAVSDATGNAHFTFQRPLRNGTRGEVVAARITSSAGGVATALDAELWLFHTDVAAVADNAAWTLTDAEAVTRIGVVEFPTADWRLNANNCGCDVYPNIPFVAARDGAGTEISLYGQLVARNGYTPASGEVITVELVIAQY